MLQKYQHLIYANETYKEKVKSECIDLVVKEHKECSREKVITSILSDEPNDINEEYNMYLLMTEGHLLFDKAVEKFGNELWQGVAWKNKICKRRCPFGDVCKKHLIKIDNECFCYGQIYSRKITESTILEMLEKHSVKLLNPDNSLYIDLNNNANDYELQCFGNFFFEYEWFIWWFGDDGGRKDKRVNGNDVIRLL